MKNVVQKTASLVLAIIIGTFGTLSVNAAIPQQQVERNNMLQTKDTVSITPYFTHTNFMSYAFSINSGGLSYVDGYMELEPNANSCKISANLQRKKGIGSWTSVKTFTCSGKMYAMMSNDWYLLSGYDYRVLFTFSTYKDGALVEQISRSSDIKKY